MNYNQRSKQTKQLLKKTFPNYKVSVRQGKGTACGWLDCTIIAPFPKGCTCEIGENIATWAKVPYTYKYRKSEYCEKCHQLWLDVRDKADKAINNSNIEFSHYYSDDGYGTKRKEVLTNIKIGIE
jgi:hypothetical protein